MTAWTSRVPSSSGRSRCCSAESSGADSPMWAGSTAKMRSNEGIFFSIRLHSSTRRAPSSRRQLGVDPHEEVLLLGPDAGLEVEGPRRPGEQVVDGLLDLQPHVALELLALERAELDQDLAELVLAVAFLAVDRLLQRAPGVIRPLRTRMSPSRSRRLTIAA